MIETTAASIKKEEGGSSTEAADSPGNADKGKRLLMKEWLQYLLDTNKMPDILQWVNKNDGLFRIKWLHKATENWSVSSDAILFKEWCMHTGKYDPKQENPRRWKANFRCALNSLPDVVIVKELCVKKGKDAYRVFKILPEKLPEKVKEKQEQARKRRRLDLPKRQSGGHAAGKEILENADVSYMSTNVGSSDGDYDSTSSESSGDDATTRAAEAVTATQTQPTQYQLQDGFNGMDALCTAALLMGDMASGMTGTGSLPPSTTVIRQVTASSLHNDIVAYYHPVVSEKLPTSSELYAEQPTKRRRWPASSRPAATIATSGAAATAAAAAAAAATAAHKASIASLLADGSLMQRGAAGLLSLLPPTSQNATEQSIAAPIREIVLTIDTNPLSLPPSGTIIPVASMDATTMSIPSAACVSVSAAVASRPQQHLLPVRLLSGQHQHHGVHHLLPSVHVDAAALQGTHLPKRVGSTVHVQVTSTPAAQHQQQKVAAPPAAAATAVAVSATVAAAAAAVTKALAASPGGPGHDQCPVLCFGSLDTVLSPHRVAPAGTASKLPNATSVAAEAAIRAATSATRPPTVDAAQTATIDPPSSQGLAAELPAASEVKPEMTIGRTTLVPELPAPSRTMPEATIGRTLCGTTAASVSSSPAAPVTVEACSASAVAAACIGTRPDTVGGSSHSGIDGSCPVDICPNSESVGTESGCSSVTLLAAAPTAERVTSEHPSTYPPSATAADAYARLKQAVGEADFSRSGFVMMPTAAIRLVRLRDLEFPAVDVCVTIDERFAAVVAAAGGQVGRDHELWTGLPEAFACLADVAALLKRLSEFCCCRGGHSDAGLPVGPCSAPASDARSSSSCLRHRSDACSLLVRRADCCEACRPPPQQVGGCSGGPCGRNDEVGRIASASAPELGRTTV